MDVSITTTLQIKKTEVKNNLSKIVEPVRDSELKQTDSKIHTLYNTQPPLLNNSVTTVDPVIHIVMTRMSWDGKEFTKGLVTQRKNWLKFRKYFMYHFFKTKYH